MNQPAQSRGLEAKVNLPVYRYIPDVALWFGDIENVKETQIDGEARVRSLPHGKFTLSTQATELGATSNVFMIVLGDCDFFDDRHVAFGEVLIGDSRIILDQLVASIITEPCDRVSPLCDIKITEARIEDAK